MSPSETLNTQTHPHKYLTCTRLQCDLTQYTHVYCSQLYDSVHMLLHACTFVSIAQHEYGNGLISILFRNNHTFIVIIDSHSKQLEVFNMRSTTDKRTCKVLQTLLVVYWKQSQMIDQSPFLQFQNLYKEEWSEAYFNAIVSHRY